MMYNIIQYATIVNRNPLSHENKDSRQLLEKAMHNEKEFHYHHILINYQCTNLESYGELNDDYFINVGSVVLEKMIYVIVTHTFIIFIYAPFVTKF